MVKKKTDMLHVVIEVKTIMLDIEVGMIDTLDVG